MHPHVARSYTPPPPRQSLLFDISLTLSNHLLLAPCSSVIHFLPRQSLLFDISLTLSNHLLLAPCSSVIHFLPRQSLLFDISPHSVQPSSLGFSSSRLPPFPSLSFLCSAHIFVSHTTSTIFPGLCLRFLPLWLFYFNSRICLNCWTDEGLCAYKLPVVKHIVS